MLKIGETAPLNIKVLDQSSKQTSLLSILGKPTVIYFYPKDNTPGCTKEACGFRDINIELQTLGIQVIGVSGDSFESHMKFSEKQKLNFPLWSDQKRELISSFGALGKKSMFGKTYLGIKRMTFALDKKGVVIKVWSKVKPQEHALEVLEFFKNHIS